MAVNPLIKSIRIGSCITLCWNRSSVNNTKIVRS
nr:MAG TPA: hypothetical protein [Caudoviricetes sp.]